MTGDPLEVWSYARGEGPHILGILGFDFFVGSDQNTLKLIFTASLLNV